MFGCAGAAKGVEPGTLAELDGVPWEIALAPRQSGASVYVLPGTFPPSPDHPLHDHLFASPGQPRIARRGNCRRAGVRGDVAYVSLTSGRMVLQHAAARVAVRVDAGTRFALRKTVAEVPRVEVGDRLSVTGARCGDTVVATSIAAAP